MHVMRNTALKVLPLLVALWATLAVLGGPVVLAKKAENADGGSAKAGIGLCAVTVALLLSKGVRKRAVPLTEGMPLRGLPRLLFSRTPASPEPPPPGVPILELLRVIRT